MPCGGASYRCAAVFVVPGACGGEYGNEHEAVIVSEYCPDCRDVCGAGSPESTVRLQSGIRLQ